MMSSLIYWVRVINETIKDIFFINFLLLGYQVDDVANKFSKFIDSKDQPKSDANNVDGLVDRMATLSQVSKTTQNKCY